MYVTVMTASLRERLTVTPAYIVSSMVQCSVCPSVLVFTIWCCCSRLSFILSCIPRVSIYGMCTCVSARRMYVRPPMRTVAVQWDPNDFTWTSSLQPQLSVIYNESPSELPVVKLQSRSHTTYLMESGDKEDNEDSDVTDCIKVPGALYLKPS